jgi:hypothetical protein
MSSSALAGTGHGPASTGIRRKPIYTFPSPSSNISTPLRIERYASLPVPHKPPQPSHEVILPPPPVPKSELKASVRPKPKLVRPFRPPLPLYHPSGRLALSLPPLDPAVLGLPMTYSMQIPRNPSAIRASSRTRRPTTKLRDSIGVETQPVLLPVAPATTSVIVVSEKDAQNERDRGRKVQDKDKSATSRRKRPSASKRKRREHEDDGTYPAKRSRNPRRAAGLGNGISASRDASVDPTADFSVDQEETTEVDQPEETKSVGMNHVEGGGSDEMRGSSASEGTETSLPSAVTRSQTHLNGNLALAEKEDDKFRNDVEAIRDKEIMENGKVPQQDDMDIANTSLPEAPDV